MSHDDDPSGAEPRPDAPTRPKANFCPWCGHPAQGLKQCSQCERPLQDTRLGATIDGRYRIESLLGQGGMGRVYKATHLGIGEPVVLKFLLAQHARSPDQRTRFKREAVALARLRHPGIVAVHDFGENDGAPYIVMELISGRPLTSYIGPEQQIPLTQLGHYFDQVLQVLEAAHGMDIVHRDLKPDNVMVLEAGDRAEHIKVLDFGLAMVIDPTEKERLTMPGAVFGTPWYMSPEQCNGEVVGPPTDIYAVAVMLYEALAGQCPFDGQSTAQVMAQQLYAQPPSLREKGLSRELPRGLEGLVMRAMSKRPEERPTASALRDELAAAIAGSDAGSQAAQAVDERVRYGTLAREERVLPEAGPTRSGPTEPDLRRVVAGPRVMLWKLPAERAHDLRAALAVSGARTVVFDGERPPASWATDSGEVQAPQAVVLSASAPQVTERLTLLKAEELTRKLPVMVIDVGEPEEIPGLIRAGASDACLAEVSLDSIGQKVLRLVKRRR